MLRSLVGQQQLLQLLLLMDEPTDRGVPQVGGEKAKGEFSEPVPPPLFVE
jgi:hypothetical protein